MSFHLICVNPFHGYVKGQRVTDQDEVTKLSADRDHHFVRVAAPAPVVEEEQQPAPAPALIFSDK